MTKGLTRAAGSFCYHVGATADGRVGGFESCQAFFPLWPALLRPDPSRASLKVIRHLCILKSSKKISRLAWTPGRGEVG